MRSIHAIALFSLTAIMLATSLCSEAQARRSGKRTSSHASASRATAPTAAPVAPAAPVMLIGEFKTPGPISFKTGMTVKQAIVAAGGFTEQANTSAVRLSRTGKGWVGALDGKKALDDDLFQNIVLKPGDSLVADPIAADHAEPKAAAPTQPQSVPEPKPAVVEKAAPAPVQASTPEAKTPATPEPTVDPGKIAIVGEVAQPGAFVYRPIMLQDALTAAGGLKKCADRGRIVIYRDGLNVSDLKKARKVSYDLCKVEKGKAEDIALLPGDVVEVPLHRDRSVLGQISGMFNRLAGQVISLASGPARPLLTAANPAAGFLINAVAPSSRSTTINGIAGSVQPTAPGANAASGRAPTKLEEALAKAIASEPPDVRARIMKNVQASLVLN